MYLLIQDPDSMDKPPTRLQNPPGIRPFQVIVSLFSLPRYGDWDPTPIVAYFFAFFFGLMLNDVIYAIGLILLARFLLNPICAYIKGQRTEPIEGSLIIFPHLHTGEYEIHCPSTLILAISFSEFKYKFTNWMTLFLLSHAALHWIKGGTLIYNQI